MWRSSTDQLQNHRQTFSLRNIGLLYEVELSRGIIVITGS